MNTEKLKKMLAAKLEQKKNLDARMIESDSKEERAAIGETLAALAAEIKDCEELLSEMDEPAEPNDTGAASAASATAASNAAFATAVSSVPSALRASPFA